MSRYPRKRSRKASIIKGAIFMTEAALVALLALSLDRLEINIWLGTPMFVGCLYFTAFSVSPIARFIDKHFPPKRIPE